MLGIVVVGAVSDNGEGDASGTGVVFKMVADEEEEDEELSVSDSKSFSSVYVPATSSTKPLARRLERLLGQSVSFESCLLRRSALGAFGGRAREGFAEGVVGSSLQYVWWRQR